MCGIGGYWGRFGPELLERMNAAMAHRGPDDSGVYVDPERGVGLAHRRLAIIDLSPSGAQPMWDATESVCTVYNGEIYNYRELKNELVGAGFEFDSDCDTEVLLNLYRRDGPEMLERLNGMFAFAIWDPDRSRMLVARDGAGVKPLYWSETDHGFLFASELKGLLQSRKVDRELEPRAIHEYMSFLWSTAPETPLAEVQKLEPGQAIEVVDGEVTEAWTFYDLPYSGDKMDIGREEAIERVHDRLREAVERQLVADVPVGAFLSGGLDSSSLVALYREIAPDREIECFTIGFEGAEDDEGWEGFAADLPYARQVADRLDVNLSTVTVGPDMVRRLPEMVYHLDEPQGDLAPLNALFISELSRKRDIKVLLSGAGGDDVFTGYRRHWALRLERFWSWLPRPARQILEDLARRLPESHPTLRRLSQAFRFASLDGDERIASYFYWMEPEGLVDLYSPELQRAVRARAPLQSLLETMERLPEGVSRLDKMLYLEAKHFLADHNLNYTDKTAMAAGVEVRVPFLDPELVALATGLPDAYKQRGSEGKWVLKKAMERYLPDEVVWRPKTGFGLPLRRWLHGELKPLRDELLSTRSLRHRGLFDPAAVRRLLEADEAGQQDASYVILQMMVVELWCRTFVDPARPEIPSL